ncbi:cytochrome C5 [Microbacterium maritypicum]|uniref:cytochrome C5 n=1 Tax=Microbacterium maritypicum TaxID=33918 RepID=UPI003D6FE49F
MTSPALDTLLARIVESGLLEEPLAENGLVYGRASIDAAGTVVNVNVDPELEDEDEQGDDVDHDALIAAVSRILSVGESRWRAIIDEVAADIDDAVDDEPVVEQIDLRDDLEATSVVVFADAVLLAFLAPKQFPDSRILVQLDEDLEVDGVEVRELDGSETIAFDTLDDLLDHISGPDESAAPA